MRIPPRSRLLLLFLVGILLAGLAGARDAELSPEDAALADRVEERFEVLPLSDGLLLESRDRSDWKAVEVSPGRIAVDGRRIDSRSRLFEQLGDDARLMVELSGLSEARLKALFAPDGVDRGQQEQELSPDEIAVDELEVLEEDEQATADSEPEPRREEEHAAGSSRSAPIRIGDVEVATASFSSDAKVVVGGEVVVEEDERYRDVVVFGGSLWVDGEVRGDAAVIGGPATIDGRVTGDVMAFGGDVRLLEDADVEGDVTSVGGDVEKERGARVGGRISELSILGPQLDVDHLTDFFEDRGRAWERSWFELGRIWGRVWQLMGLVFLAFLACVVRVVAPRMVDRIDRQTEREPWKAALVGFAAVLLFVPFLVTLAVILTISIIGIPLLLLLPFLCLGFVIAAFVGFVGVAQRLGGWLQTRFGLELGPLALVLLGVASIYVWGFLGDVLGMGGWPLTFFAVMLGVFGFLLEVAAWSVGLGSVILTRIGGSSGDPLRYETAPGPRSDFSPPPFPVAERDAGDDPSPEGAPAEPGSPEDAAVDVDDLDLSDLELSSTNPEGPDEVAEEATEAESSSDAAATEDDPKGA